MTTTITIKGKSHVILFFKFESVLTSERGQVDDISCPYLVGAGVNFSTVAFLSEW